MLNKKSKLPSNYILLLSMLYVAISIAATATAYKFVTLNTGNVSGATIIFPLNSFLCFIIAEVYGYNQVKPIIWLGLVCEFVFAFLVVLVINLPSPSFWTLQPDFNNVLGSSIRFVFSGTIADIVGMFGGAYLISKWKIIMRGRHFWIRCVLSAIISDLLMTLIIVIPAFLGKVPIHNLLSILVSGYLLHIIYAAVLIWPAFLVVIWLKKIENIDVYDYGIAYNPFKFNNPTRNIYAIHAATNQVS
jgi:uncharacterized integral membrane protein (TIGR00697 family)